MPQEPASEIYSSERHVSRTEEAISRTEEADWTIINKALRY
jgi:hypothetical protein